MKNKVMRKVLLTIMATSVVLGSTCITSFAQTNETVEPVLEEKSSTEQAGEEQIKTEGSAFSTPGNGQLVDDKGSDGTKQFLTVKTKNGNTFYMIIDRAGTTENVYMMSLVDENDLAEFVDGFPKEDPKKEPTVVLPENNQPDVNKSELVVPTPPKTDKKENPNHMMSYILLFAVLFLGLGGAGVYLSSKRQHQKEEDMVEEGLEYEENIYINEDEENTKK